MSNVCVIAEFLVCLFYWSIISWTHIPNHVNKCKRFYYCHMLNFSVHLLPLVFTWVPLFIEPSLVQKRGYMWFLVLLVVFGCFHVPYTLLISQLYPLVDFTTFWGYLMTLICLVISFAGFALAKWVSNKTHKRLKFNIEGVNMEEENLVENRVQD
jgi:uncharacterized membrane protein